MVVTWNECGPANGFRSNDEPDNDSLQSNDVAAVAPLAQTASTKLNTIILIP